MGSHSGRLFLSWRCRKAAHPGRKCRAVCKLQNVIFRNPSISGAAIGVAPPSCRHNAAGTATLRCSKLRERVERRELVLGGKPFGLAGPYEKLVGKVEF